MANAKWDIMHIQITVLFFKVEQDNMYNIQ